LSKSDKFKDKNVLLVCAETFSWPMHYLAEELRPKCNSISAIFIQPGESYFNAPDYTLFRELNGDVNIHEMSSVVKDYLAQYKNAKNNINFEYINKIERDYSAYSSLNEQLLSEMSLLPYYHDRKYYEHIDYNKILLYVQLYYKYIENMFINNKPDVILDCDVDFFGRSVLLEVSNKYCVPYISIDHARVDGYVLPTTALVKERNYHITSSFENHLKDPDIASDKNLAEWYKVVKKQMGDIPSVFKQMHNDHAFSIIRLLRRSILQTIVSIRYFSFKKFKLNVFNKISSPICSNMVKSYQAMYMYYVRRFYLEYSNLFVKRDLSKINYIYLPLHVIPESSTTVLSPYYINETFIIESISKAIRADQYVVVKEHWSMIGFRPISFYKKVKGLPNVILIDPTNYDLPRDYIKNSDLVVTISGSAALEASFMGKNSLVFSDVIYGMLSSVKKISIDHNLRKTIAKHIEYEMPEKELYAYLKTLAEWGAKVRLKTLLMPPDRVDRDRIKQDIKNLLTVFSDGIKLYKMDIDLKNEI
jgi:hypothetical protein